MDANGDTTEGIYADLNAGTGVSSFTDGPTMAYAAKSNCLDGNELDVPNAIELNYKTPYKIPNDRTYAEVKCTTD